jgi:hypothetical protein
LEVAPRNRNSDGNAFSHYLDATERNLDRGRVLPRFDGRIGGRKSQRIHRAGRGNAEA